RDSIAASEGYGVLGSDSDSCKATTGDHDFRTIAGLAGILVMDDVAVCACGPPGLNADLLRLSSVVERRPAFGVLAERDHIGVIGVEVRSLGVAHMVVPLNHRHDAGRAVVTDPLSGGAVGVGDQTISLRRR